MRKLEWCLVVVMILSCGGAWGQITPSGDVVDLMDGLLVETGVDAAVEANGNFAAKGAAIGKGAGT
jgi:hypothetical protein